MYQYYTHKTANKANNKLNLEWAEQCSKMRDTGMTLKQIGDTFGISSEAVRTKIQVYKRKVK